MTKISQLSSIGDSLAVDDQFIIRDVSDVSTPNKSVTVSGITRALDLGTAAAPAIAFASDKNTGIYSPGADQVAISTNGTGRLFIDASGNVNIGSAIGYGETLGVRGTFMAQATNVVNRITEAGSVGYWGTVTNHDLAFQTNGAEKLRITAAGLVGLGTTAPDQKLTVAGSIRIVDNNALIFQQNAGVAVGTISMRNSAGVQKAAVASYYNVADEGALEFIGPTGSTNMLLTSAGRLGIGTTSPVGKLSITTSSATAPGTLASSTWDSTYSLIAGATGNNVGGCVGLGFVTGGISAGYGTQIVSLAPASDWYPINYHANIHVWYGNGSEKARLDSSGRLLVGTSTARTNFIVDGIGYAPLAQLGDASSVVQASFVRAVSPFIGLAASNAAASETNTGNISFFGNDGTNLIRTAQISSVVDGTPGTNDMPGRLVFSTTADGASSPTERMRIDSAGKVGIGTSAPSETLHLGGGNARIGKWESGGSTVFVSAGIGSSATPTYGSLSFIGYSGTSADVVKGRIRSADVSTTNSTIGSLLFETQTGVSTITEAMRIDDTSRLLVGLTSANTSGAKLQTYDGLTFPATQVASADPNTLDDYEEGTWTPTIAGSGTAGTVTYVARQGQYTKIGNTVRAHVYVDWNSGASGTGDLRITGLPFNAANANNVYFSCAIGAANNIALTASNYMTAYTPPAQAYVSVAQSPTGGGASTNVPWDAAGYIILTAFYLVA